jgi:glycosyltransferase involved in cell wall biosynthesis
VSTAEGRRPRVVCACDFHLRYCTRLAAGLGREGAEVVLLTRDHDLEFGSEAGAARAFVGATTGAGVAHRALGGRVRSPSGWARAARMRRELRRFDPEVVHLQESVGNDPRLLLATAVSRRRLAVTIHDPSPHPGEGAPRQDAFLNSALVRAAGLVFVHGEALKRQLVERLHPRAAVVVVPHGVAAAAVTPVPPDPSLLFFGRISHYKGIDVLLDAMASVWESVPGARLTIAGEGDLEPHPALADSRVTLRQGHVPDAEVPGLVEAARSVVLPYREASQSGVGSLVKPYGRPLVVTDVGGLPELVADGSGLTVPSQDPRALAAALVEVLTETSLAARLGAAGAATATAGASWDTVARQTLDAYREHLGVG